MTSITAVATVAIPVSDQERALAFYIQTLGFERRREATLPQGARWLEVAPPGAATTLAIVATDGPGVDTGIRLASSDAVADHAALSAAGVDVDPEILRWEGVPPMFGLRDPDGNRLVLVEQAPVMDGDRFTKVHLDDVEDAALVNGLGHRWQARVAREPLRARDTGVAHFRLRAGRRSPFMHRHRRAEEIYLVLSGSGRLMLDGELLAVTPGDAIRVAAPVARAFEAGPEELEFLAVGAHHPGDGELVDDDWVR